MPNESQPTSPEAQEVPLEERLTDAEKVPVAERVIKDTEHGFRGFWTITPPPGEILPEGEETEIDIRRLANKTQDRIASDWREKQEALLSLFNELMQRGDWVFKRRQLQNMTVRELLKRKYALVREKQAQEASQQKE